MPSLRERFEAPARARTVMGDDVVNGRAAAPLCGDVVRVGVHVEDGRVRDAGFQASGCPVAIAAADLACEAAEGEGVGRAAEAARRALADAFRDVARAERGCVVLALRALEDALARAGVEVSSAADARPFDPGEQVPLVRSRPLRASDTVK